MELQRVSCVTAARLQVSVPHPGRAQCCAVQEQLSGDFGGRPAEKRPVPPPGSSSLLKVARGTDVCSDSKLSSSLLGAEELCGPHCCNFAGVLGRTEMVWRSLIVARRHCAQPFPPPTPPANAPLLSIVPPINCLSASHLSLCSSSFPSPISPPPCFDCMPTTMLAR